MLIFIVMIVELMVIAGVFLLLGEKILKAIFP